MTTRYLDTLLGKHERILLITRQHWLVLLRDTLVEFALLVGIAVLVTIASAVNRVALWGSLLLLVPVVGIARDVLLWQYRQYVITNRRVIQVSGVLNKSITDSSLDKVNDVKMEQTALGRLLNYGDIEILTASELGVNLIQRIANPVGFKTAMLNAREGAGQQESAPAAGDEPRPGDIPGMIAQLDRLRREGILSDTEFQQKKKELLARM
ncbi:MAG: PH domain-containing protein [Chloroflexi bacterium]|nr:PH domain-containing protein [Chloroflexota bacterium]